MITIAQTYTAIAVNLSAFFLASGGAEPYTYSVLSGGAGGSIDAVTGFYTAPSILSSDPNFANDTILVTDDNGDTAQATILIGTPLILFCDILKHEMGLDDKHIYLWDQKLSQPTDGNLYIAVSIASCKAFGNTNLSVSSGSGMNQIQSVNMQATLDLDLISRGPAARDRKEEVLFALASVYSQQQQTANSFLVGRLPAGSRFINLSDIDGAAIPYRFRVSVSIQYFAQKILPAQHFDSFADPEILIS